MEVTQGPQLLREWLDKHRLSQRDLADRVGVSQAAISKIINGKVRPGLGLATLVEIGTAYARPEGHCLVPPVPAQSWLRDADRGRVEELARAREKIARTQRADLIRAVQSALAAESELAEQDLEAVITGGDRPSDAEVLKIAALALQTVRRWRPQRGGLR